MDRHWARLGRLSDRMGAGFQYAIPLVQDLYRRRRTARQLDRLVPDKLKDRGTIRSQFAHVIDVMPTLLDLAEVPPLATVHGKPAKAMQGASLAPVLRDAATPAPRREQYYECWANRAYYRTTGLRSQCKSGARRSISTIGRCTPMPRISPRAWICAASIPKSSRS